MTITVTEEMIEAGARVHCPFAFEDSDTMPIHRAQSRDEARKEVRAILEAALAEHVVVRAQEPLPMLADITQIIFDGWQSGDSPIEIAAEILQEFDGASVSRHDRAGTDIVEDGQ